MLVKDLKQIIQDANGSRIILPNFQRDFTWERAQQKSLICSVLCKIPFGTVLTLDGPKNYFSSRLIGRKPNIEVDSEALLSEVTYLLDGQQRVTTLWNAFTDIYKGLTLEEKNALYNDTPKKLHSRWAISISVDAEKESDTFCYKTLNLSQGYLDKLLPDEIEGNIICNNGVKGNNWNFKEGLDMPNRLKKSSQESKRYKKYIEDNGLIPLHVIFEPSQLSKFTSLLSTRRATEIKEEFRNLFNDKEEFDHLTDDQKQIASHMFNINSSKEWIEFSNSDEFDFVGDLNSIVDGKADEWKNELHMFLTQVATTRVGIVEVLANDVHKAHVIFDIINKTGTKLTTFDLFCAKFPRLNIRRKIEEKVPELYGLRDKNNSVDKEFLNQLLNTLGVVIAHKTYGSETDIPIEAIKGNGLFTVDKEVLVEIFDDVLTSTINACEFANSYLGVQKIAQLPYKLQLVIIGVGFYLKAKDCNNFKNILKYIYWYSLFSGRYQNSQNKRCVEDINTIRKLTYFGGKSSFLESKYRIYSKTYEKILSVTEYNDFDTISLTKTDDKESVFKGVEKSILQYVLSKKPFDFPPNSTVRLEAAKKELEIHHIIPLASVTKIEESTKDYRNQPTHILNSPLNMSYISKSSNRKIGQKSIDNYWTELEENTKQVHFLPENAPHSYSTENQQALESWYKLRFDKIKHSIQNDLLSWNDASNNFAEDKKED